ncbi:hypothetical protein BDY21DRAFT_20445 [Lineolata rhizophorae]|uniref:Carrier domain-containing protein n=1 Tax=Lineolata rhizophorae TaxID=578093 RepID=A0A6A6P255_9PEZI|nr:hypothetical protein BDY21DRAFT_20445 [Lineolata rhizophorae]
MAARTLTPFPNLASPASHNDISRQEAKVSIGIDLPEEVLVLSFATLIGGYCDRDLVTILSDESVLEVNVANSHFNETEKTNSASPDYRGTGIFFKHRPAHLLDLELCYDVSRKSGCLAASSKIPKAHMSQLVLQLEAAVLRKVSPENAMASLNNPDLMLSVANPKPSMLDGSGLLHELLRLEAKDGESLAIEYSDLAGWHQSLSYSMLEQLTNDWAAQIQQLLLSSGVRGPCVVPVLVPQSQQLYVALIAILKAGAAFCPLSLDAPIERVRFVIQDVSARVVITTSELKDKIPPVDSLQVLEIDSESNSPCLRSKALFDTATRPSDLAYVMYTSGSTGTPKGVGIQHSAVTQSLLAHDRHIPAFSRFLQFAAPTFDVSVFEIFFPLFRGSTLVSCDRKQLLSDLPSAINKLNIDAAELTPTVASTLLERRSRVPGLRLLLTIGEMLTSTVVQEFGGNNDEKSILWGMYGPTEAAIHCTLQTSFRKDSRVGNIGIPLDTVSALIAAPPSANKSPQNSDFEVLPVGQVGELVVGGHQLSKGYLNRPEQTAAVLFGHQEFGTLYRTGDKARMLLDGTLECLGRIQSGQVKLRGQRIELGEVEQVASKAHRCRFAVASVVDGILVVFCLAQNDDLSVENIMQVCKDWLPAFMLPGDVIILRELPSLPSGKVDRKRLEADYKRRNTQNTRHDSGLDSNGREILSILEDVLGQNINPESSLTASGIDSLLAIRVASSLRSAGYPLAVVDVLGAHTFLDLLARVQSPGKQPRPEEPAQLLDPFKNSREAALDDGAISNSKFHIEDIIDCSPVQAAMLAEVAVQSSSYCNWVELAFSPGSEVYDLVKMLNALASKNEILRSGFLLCKAAKHSFVQIIWRSLEDSQFQMVDEFSRDYTLSSTESLLRPLRFQLLKSDNSRVLVQIPHFLYDGWSMDLMVEDLKIATKGNNLPDRPQFREVVKYTSKLTGSGPRTESAEHWQNLMQDFRPCLLPNFNGTVVQDDHLTSTRHVFDLPLDRLKKAAAAARCTPQVFFQAAMAWILTSYLGNGDVVFGSVSSGRSIPVTHIEEIIGPCITTLPVRAKISQMRTVQDLLSTIQAQNRSMLEHGDVPLRELKSLCGFRPGSLLFDVLFVWQETLSSRMSTSDAVTIIDSKDKLEFNLVLEVEPFPESVTVKVNYRSSSLPASQVDLLLRQLDDLVDFLMAHYDAPIEQVDSCFSTPSLSIQNPYPDTLLIDNGLSGAVEAMARESPEKEAIAFGRLGADKDMKTEVVTYVQLNKSANKLARLLRSRGIKQGELVCVWMTKSIDLYIAILATIKAGAGYVPLVPETPYDRVQSIVEQSGVSVCFCDDTTFSRTQNIGFGEVVDVPAVNLKGFQDHNLNLPFQGSDFSYAIFTSGSTGKPKGVLVTHANLASNLRVLGEIYPVTDDSRLLQSCSHAFDVSVFEIFFSWYSGMCLCSASKDDLFNDLERAIREFRVTHLSMTPTVAGLVNPQNVPTVKFLVTAGEAVTEHVMRAWAGKGLYQGYGPSETTNICTLNPRVKTTDLINNIGPPLRNTSAFVVDPSSEKLVPSGGVGELCFGGDQVFRGYLGPTELTESRLIHHAEYGRLYRSGDLGRLIPNGYILFAGRNDDQVKLRGQRIELGELNQCLLDSGDASDCVTLVVEASRAKSQQLVSFWVPFSLSSREFNLLPTKQGITTSIDKIYESLEASLPTYMIPSALVPITMLPMTATSKIDKSKLLSTFAGLDIQYLNAVGRNVRDGSEGDWSETERKIADSLGEVLNVPQSNVGRNSSFFGLGLDSITAINLSSLLRHQNVTVPVSKILRHPTVSKLARNLEPSNATLISTDTLKTVFDSATIENIRRSFRQSRKSVEKILPCTPLQEAMLSAGNLSPSPAYLNRMVFKTSIDISRMVNCWNFMVSRHEILRTCFYPTENAGFAYAQVVLQDCNMSYSVIRSDPEEMRKKIDEFSQKAAASFSNPYHPPLALCFVNSGTITEVALCCHHAMYDGIAMSQLLAEAEDYLNGKILPAPASFEPFLAHMVAMGPLEKDHFWKEMFADLEASPFPNLTGKTTTAQKQLVGTHTVSRILDISLSSVESECQKLSTTLLALAQASWVKLLSHYQRSEDITFGNVVSGRTVAIDGVDKIVAPCFNTVPLRIGLRNAERNIDLVSVLQRLNADSLPLQLTPLRRLQSLYGVSGNRLFDTLFILQHRSKELDSRIWTLEEDAGVMDLPLVCELVPSPQNDTLAVIVHSQNSTVHPEHVNHIQDMFSSAFYSCIQYPSARVSDLVIRSGQCLSISNGNFQTLHPPHGPLLHSAFEAVASQSPERTALDFLHADHSRTQLSFRELNERSNQIAHALVDRGVNFEDAIPICIAKSPNFYASILGVLKAGCAFTPIDPKLPEDRKNLMVTDLGASVVLFDDETDVSWIEGYATLEIESTKSLSTENIEVPALGETNLAYRLYTSGSTGTPKAVSVEHRNPVQTIETSRSIIPWAPQTRLLQFAAITFDMCYYDCFLAWSFGFTLCSSEQQLMFNELPSVINWMEASMLDLTPSVASQLNRADVPSVEYLYCIGEAMPQALVEHWSGTCVNSYGPTEAAFCCTIFQTREEVKSNIIGKPFPTTSFAIMSDDCNQALPVFAVGELYIGGSQVARGYHANLELTSSRFIERSTCRLYRSGDLVRMLGDGSFEFIGRADDQVKIRGLRVELDEISHVLRSAHHSISSAVVQVLRTSSNSKDQLVAFLAVRSTDAKEEVKMVARDMAMKKLPSNMVPNFYILIDRLPLSPAGKSDKRALAAIFRNSPESTSARPDDGLDNECDWSSLEQDVRSTLSELSQVAHGQIRRSTTIFQLGLDSISAVQLASKLRKRGFGITAGDVLENPTCESMADFLERSNQRLGAEHERDFQHFEKQYKEQITQEVGVANREVKKVRPCTPLQAALLARFVQTNGQSYFNFLHLQLKKGLAGSAIHESWKTVCHKHEMLRTGFVELQSASSSFAMLTYEQPYVRPLIEVWTARGCTSESIKVWKQESTNDVLHTLHLPPWRMLVVETDTGLEAHLGLLHALYDAHSLQLILNDLDIVYQGGEVGPCLSIDLALGSILDGVDENVQEHMAFWEDVGSNLAITRFPNLSPTRTAKNETIVASKVSSAELSNLQLRCRNANITLQVAAQASWIRMLSSYTGEQSVTFGTVLSGRISDTLENASFPCITTVPFPSTNHAENRKLLESVMSFTASMQKHQFSKLADIQRWTGHPNEALFDTLFAFQKFTTAAMPGEKIWKLVGDEATADYPVSIEVEPTSENRLCYRLTFASDVLPREQGPLLLDQLDELVQHILSNPDGTSDDISMLRPNLLSITPPEIPVLPSDVRLLHEFVEVSAQKTPHKVALEFATAIETSKVRSKTWTYAQLNTAGNKLAHLITRHGVTPGNKIAICFDKCPEASFAILGILKAGCAYVALDPNAPKARKIFMVRDSKSLLILSMRGQSDDLGEVEVPIVNLDEFARFKLPTSRPTLSRKILPEDLSYCLYTSGTTGTPKGCELTHENAVQAMLSFQRLFTGRWDENSRWLQFASFHFDVSVLEQYWSWSVGIRLVSAPRDLIFQDLAEAIRALKITHIDLTPSLARILQPEDVPSLCHGVFITGGEQLKQEILDVWGPVGAIHNGYGPTEATIGVTMLPRVSEVDKPSNIGTQFLNVGSFVLKPNSDIPVLRGGLGELCVSGKLVGKGYLNRPDLTKSRFPYLERFGEKVYRTGDLVRILHNKSFEFVGRADDQVKLRGQRLEIGEINSVVRQSSRDVSDVTTLVIKHPNQQREQLVSFVDVSPAHNKRNGLEVCIDTSIVDTITSIRYACRGKLPGYMVPTHIIPISFMPLSTNNKADTKKLRELYQNLPSELLQNISGAQASSITEWTHQERSIAKVLSTMSQVKNQDVGRTSNIFELGLDSISVISFAKTLRKAGFQGAQPSVIMKHPVIDQLARVLAEGGLATSDQGSVLASKQAIAAFQHRQKQRLLKSLGVSHQNIEVIAPCTPLQQGLISRSLKANQPLYFGAFRYSLEEGVDLERLQLAWTRVQENVQVLRTLFVPTDDGHAQVVLLKQNLPWREEALDGALDEFLSRQHFRWWLENKEDLKRPFEVVIARSHNKCIMVLHLFHALYDGNSFSILMSKLVREYSGTQNIDYGPSFHDVLPFGPLRRIDDAQSFWNKQLAAAEYKPLPLKHPDKEPEVVHIATELSVDSATFDDIRRKLNTTHQALVQACWSTVLHELIGGPVTVGTIVSGRSIDYDGADRAIGPLFNTIPFHVAFERNDTWADIIRKCHAFNTSAVPYQHTPLRDILKWTKQGTIKQLFDTLFVFEIASENSMEVENLAPWSPLADDLQADYPLALEAVLRLDEKLHLTLITQSHVMNWEEATATVQKVRRALRTLLHNAEASISELIAITESVDGGHEGRDPAFTNGVCSWNEAEFVWNDKARAIQGEISQLAEVQHSEVNARTSIFELGLDSIDAIKLSSRLKKSGIHIPVSLIVRNETIERMVQTLSSESTHIKGHLNGNRRESLQAQLENALAGADFDMASVDQVLPLTPLQEGMVADMMSSGFSRYYNHDVLKLSAQTDVLRLEDAWQKVVAHSPILRTIFVEIDNPDVDAAFAQVIRKESEINLPEFRLRDGEDVSSVLEEITNRAASAKGQDNLFHLALVISRGETLLVVSLAHALYDGWSLGLIHSDVRAAYNGKEVDRPSYEPILGEILNGSGAAARDFWRGYLSGAPGAFFPRNKVSTRRPLVHRRERTFAIPATDVQAFCKSQGISLQAFAQSCWSCILAFYTRTLDVVFGLVLSGRDDEEANEVMFPTMNTVAVRSLLHGSATEMLRYMQDSIADIRPHQFFPLRKAQAMADTGKGSLFDSLFIYQKRPEGLENNYATDAPLYESVGSESYVEYPICVEMELMSGDIVWRIACEDSVFNGEGAEVLLARVESVFAHIINEPTQPILSFAEGNTTICDLPAVSIEHIHPKTADESDAVLSAGESDEWSVIESTIREVLSAVSKASKAEISKDVSIFHLGLDSISAIKVSSLLRKRDITLSVSELLRAATVREMAKATSGTQDTELVEFEQLGSAETIELVKSVDLNGLIPSHFTIPWENVDELLPATAGQIYMMSVWQNSQGELFHPTLQYRLTGVKSVERIQEAWDSLVAENPLLRTVLLATGDQDFPFVQVVLSTVDDNFAIEPNGLPNSSEQRHPQPRVKLTAKQVGDSEWDLLLKIHHSLYDGVSLPALISQLENLIADPTVSILSSAPPFHHFLASTVSSRVRSRRREFWTRYLSDQTPQQLIQPTKPAGERVELFVPGALSNVAKLENWARSRGINFQSLFFATFANVYASLAATQRGSGRATTAGQEDVVFGIYLANRSHAIAGLAEAAAPTVNLVPLSVRRPEQVLESAAQIQRDLQDIRSLINSGVGLWEVEKWMGIKVDAFVNFLTLPEAEEKLCGREETSNGEDIVRIGEMNDKRSGGYARVVKPHVESRDCFEEPFEVEGNVVKAAYLQSIDIEAAVRDSALDIGVFAPAEMLGLSGAEQVVEDLKTGLAGLNT